MPKKVLKSRHDSHVKRLTSHPFNKLPKPMVRGMARRAARIKKRLMLKIASLDKFIRQIEQSKRSLKKIKGPAKKKVESQLKQAVAQKTKVVEKLKTEVHKEYDKAQKAEHAEVKKLPASAIAKIDKIPDKKTLLADIKKGFVLKKPKERKSQKPKVEKKTILSQIKKGVTLTKPKPKKFQKAPSVPKPTVLSQIKEGVQLKKT